MLYKFEKIKTAKSLWDKGLGVIGWKDFRGYNGVLLPETTAVHTFFVRMPLDIVFLDADFKIIKIVEDLKPWSFSPIVWQAKHTLELPKGSVQKHKLELGTKVQLQ